MAACHRFLVSLPTSSLRSCADRVERRPRLPRWCDDDDDVGARNEFNSTALRNWLRSHSSGKFLIVCPAASREFARSPPPRGPVTALLRRADHQYLCPGHSRGISSVPGSFSDPCPAGPLMVMVITGPNCEQWNYEISKLAACAARCSRPCAPFVAGRCTGRLASPVKKRFIL